MMKKYSIWVLILVLPWLAGAENFADLAEPDPSSEALILGTWRIVDSDFVFEYTRTYVGKFFGIKFYRYKTSQKPLSDEYMYAVFKITKYKRSYLCRGIYRSGRPLAFSTSMIQFIGDNWFKVYSQRDPSKLYLEAIRIR